MNVPICQGWIGLVLACQVIWTDAWPVHAPQYPEMTGEVRVQVCIEGGSTLVKVEKRVVNGEAERPWSIEHSQCWQDGKESYCDDP